jgi:hypothetical protein
MEFHQSSNYKKEVSETDLNLIVNKIEELFTELKNKILVAGELKKIIESENDAYVYIISSRFILNIFFYNNYKIDKTIKYTIEAWVKDYKKLSFFGCSSEIINIPYQLRKKKIEEIFLEK